MLSLVMVVKDEEIQIEKALKSVENKVDEIVIIDIGATDSTLNIARKYTSNLKQVKCEKNLSRARKIGIQQATGEWILLLDADEELCINNKDLQFIYSSHNNQGFFITIKSYIKMAKEIETLNEQQIRIFKKCQYTTDQIGNQHQHDIIKSKQKAKLSSIAGEICHYGYLNKEKVYKDIELEEKKLQSQSRNFITKYRLGLYYFIVNDYNKASFFLLDCWQVFSNKKKGLEVALVFSKLLTENQKHEQNIDFVSRALEFYPNSIDLYYQRALSYWELKMVPFAVEGFLNCKNINEKESKSYFGGVGEYRPSFMLSEIFYNLANYEKAIKGYIETLRMKPNHFQSLECLIKSLRKSGKNIGEINSILNSHFKFDGENSILILAKAKYNNGYYNETIKLTKHLNSLEAKIIQAKSLINIHMYKEAKDILKEFTPDKSMYKEALLELALLHLVTGNSGGSNTLLKKMSLLGSDKRSRVYAYLAKEDNVSINSVEKEVIMNVFKRLVETKEIELLRKIESLLEQKGEQPSYYLSLGDIAQENEQFYLSINYYKKALQKGFINYKSAITLAQYTVEMGEYDSSEKLLKKALEIYPYPYHAYLQLAEVYLLLAERILKESESVTVEENDTLQKRQKILNTIKLLNNPL